MSVRWRFYFYFYGYTSVWAHIYICMRTLFVCGVLGTDSVDGYFHGDHGGKVQGSTGWLDLKITTKNAAVSFKCVEFLIMLYSGVCSELPLDYIGTIL